MHLISALAAGVAGAENGTCVINKRGTSTKAVYYDDFEGTTAKTQGATTELDLDSNGRLVAYVDEVVDIVCKSSAGVTVATFTDGVSSPLVEVKSQSFTGTDYVTAASAASNPTTLQSALDLWKTNAGSIDWKVQGVTLTQLYNQTYTLVFNVLNYGAVGDGSTDDTSAISAAITAAGVSGGCVFLPAGTYRVTSTLTLPEDVSLKGAGSETTAILMDHATNGLITTSGTSTYNGRCISGLRLAASVANTGAVVSLNSASSTFLFDCHIGSSNNTALRIFEVNFFAQRTYADFCAFETGATSSSIAANTGSSSGHTIFSRCRFISPSGYNSSLVTCGSSTHFYECHFNTAGNSVTNAFYIDIDSTTDHIVATGNHFGNPSSGTAVAFSIDSATPTITEVANLFGGSNVEAYALNAGSTNVESTFASRVARRISVTDNSAAVSINSLDYGVVHLKRTANGAQTISATPSHVGASLVLLIENATGGAMTNPTLNTANFRSLTAVNPGNGESDCRYFVSEDFGGTRKWTQIADHVDVTV